MSENSKNTPIVDATADLLKWFVLFDCQQNEQTKSLNLLLNMTKKSRKCSHLRSLSYQMSESFA